MSTEQKANPDVLDSKPDEHPVFAAIKTCDDDVERVRNFFEVDGVPVEVEDSAGMTPLMHACWKGFPKLAKFLIKQVIILLQLPLSESHLRIREYFTILKYLRERNNKT